VQITKSSLQFASFRTIQLERSCKVIIFLLVTILLFLANELRPITTDCLSKLVIDCHA